MKYAVAAPNSVTTTLQARSRKRAKRARVSPAILNTVVDHQSDNREDFLNVSDEQGCGYQVLFP